MRLPRLLFALLLGLAGCFGNQRPPDGGADGFSADAFPFPCGDMDCAPFQVCYLDAMSTGRCGDLPAICGGAPTCVCLRTSCVMITGAVCRAGFEVGNVYCWR